MGRKLKISLIGSGTVGAVITTALFKRGYRVSSIINRTGSSAARLGAKVGCTRVSTSAEDLAADTQLLLIAVPDDALESVATSVAAVRKLSVRSMAAIHFSGARASDALLPLKKKGGTTASLHPIQTFPPSRSPSQLLPRLKGIFYGIEGDEEGLKIADTLTTELGGTAIVIPREMKPLYHTACVFASNYLVVLLNALHDLARSSKLYFSWPEVFGPLMTSTMENAIRTGPAAALSGPIMRNDSKTVELHLNALAAHAPQFLPLYTVCGIDAARIARGQGKLSGDDYNAVVALFSRFIRTLPVKNIKGQP